MSLKRITKVSKSGNDGLKTSIPKDICDILQLELGESILWEISETVTEKKVIIVKV